MSMNRHSITLTVNQNQLRTLIEAIELSAFDLSQPRASFSPKEILSRRFITERLTKKLAELKARA